MSKVVRFKARLVIEQDFELDLSMYSEENPTPEYIMGVELGNLAFMGMEYFNTDGEGEITNLVIEEKEDA